MAVERKVIILCGLPGSGKSTYIKGAHYESYASIHSSDNIIEEYASAEGLTYDEAYSKYADQANSEFYKRLANDAKTGTRPIVVDRTNLTRELRSRIMSTIRENSEEGHAFEFNAIVFGKYLSIYTWARRLSSRPGKTIPADTLLAMAGSYEEPSPNEGFEDILYL